MSICGNEEDGRKQTTDESPYIWRRCAMDGLTAALAGSAEMTAVRRRVFRQLIESLLYEQMIRDPIITDAAEREYTLEGQTEEGQAVQYVFRAARKLSFDRIRLSDRPVLRIGAESAAEAESVALFVHELSGRIGAPAHLLVRFVNELQQTLWKDAQSAAEPASRPGPYDKDYDGWESAMTEGHPYHPCYKSRIGFTLADNRAYGPEFSPEFKLVWIAIRHDAVRLSTSASIGSYAAFVREQLGTAESERIGRLFGAAAPGASLEDYACVPVHPWQWERVLSTACLDQLSSGQLIFLGRAGDRYRPQQSIRTLTNLDRPDQPYVKLPMNIVNTSSGRILAQHTILNAARVSDWIGRMAEEDPYLHTELRLIVLREIVGISYDHQKLPDLLEQSVYGSLGAIWRESLHPHLTDDEAAFPFNMLTRLERAGEPTIDPWIRQHGLENWCRQLIAVATAPLLHLLYAYGAGLESHAQNMIVIVENGWPTRIALKDFHDGVRYCPSLPHPFGYPGVDYPPANHHGVNRNSFLEKERPDEVKDFMLDALLFIHLTELAFFMEKQYGLSEEAWWSLVAEAVLDYQGRFPKQSERYAQFDVFSADIEVEQLTRRRLHEGPGDCVHRAANPLHRHRPVQPDQAPRAEGAGPE
ncbi:IucA/IucC family siderophore biosynthesis protein [Saccharibacillus sp. WB 17]|nr:IucA/IucC family siderophore biosynthesis protein [Saccharibacillus sp. WB 17]